MKKSYSTFDTGRFRLFVRKRNWNPTIYTVANATPETLIVPSASYKVIRIGDRDWETKSLNLPVSKVE